jgi:hypothetical protein
MKMICFLMGIATQPAWQDDTGISNCWVIITALDEQRYR